MNSLFEPSPRRKRGLILTLSGSLLFHGSLIGVAALWPTHPVAEKSTVTVVDFGEPEPPGDLLPPAMPPNEPEAPPPLLKIVEPVDDNPPPPVEPGADEMSLATPAPRVAASRTPSRPAASAAPLTVQAQRGVSTNRPAVGTPGTGLSRAGGRWMTPRPAYPAPLRLAHVQGSGTVRITTDASGRVVNAAIVQSTGNALLDDHASRAAKNAWSGPPNATTAVPVTYRLQ